jgi:hypothetical protein
VAISSTPSGVHAQSASVGAGHRIRERRDASALRVELADVEHRSFSLHEADRRGAGNLLQ